MPLFAVTLEPLATWPLAALTTLGLVGIFTLRGGPSVGIWAVGRAALRLICSLGLAYAAFSGMLIGLRIVSPELSISVNPVWPWPIVLAMSVATVGVVLGTYPQRLAAFSPRQRTLLLGLRITAALLLILVALRPVMQWAKANDKAPLFPILTDFSRSMTTKDGPGGISRFDAQQKLLLDNRALLDQLAKKVQLPAYEYSKELLPIPSVGEAGEEAKKEPTGEQTALGYSLDMLLKDSRNQTWAGILMMGDFGQRALSPPYDMEPRLVAQQLADLRIPVYTVPFGATNLTNSGRDLIAEDLVISPTVFVKNKVIVGAKIRAIGAAGRDQTVQLLVETGGQNPKMEIRQTKKIRAKGDEDLVPVELDFIPVLPGEFRITLKVLPDENEPIVSNNELTTFVTVLKGGLSVAYFDVARNEGKPISDMAKSPDIQLDFKLIRFGKRFSDFSLEEEWFQPGKYDVYIIGDVPAAVFNQSKFKTPPLEMLHAAVDRGAGLLMLGGARSFEPGGYAESPLAVTLPVILDPSEEAKGDKVAHLTGPQMIVPTDAGLSHYVMRIDSPAQNAAKWKSLPPLNGANRLGAPKRLAEVLARNAEGKPLLVAQNFGNGRSMAFAGDTTYRWTLWGHEEASQRFWRQIILWLAHKEQQGDKTVWMKLADRRFRPNQPFDLTFGAKDADGVPIPNTEFKVQILGSNGLAIPVGAQQSGQVHTARFTDALTPGEYVASVEAIQKDKSGDKKKDKSLGSARARFIIYEHDLELHNPAADAAFAEELARTTGGKLIPPEELASFLRELLKKELQPDDKKLTTFSLWDNQVFLLIFVAIMSVEWLLRKLRGLV